MLTNTRNKQRRVFPPGERLWMALVGTRAGVAFHPAGYWQQC
jgi:hypothetical protein